KQRALALGDDEAPAGSPAVPVEPARPRTTSAPQKLSYKLQRELDALPDEIERLENEAAELERSVSQSDFYQRPRDEVEARLRALVSTKALLEAAVERWAELEEQAQRL